MAESFEKIKVEFTGHEESVQALAEAFHDSGEVPERYIRQEIDADPLAADAGGPALPTIDMSMLLDPEFSAEESAKLGSACEHWGFFQVCNNTIPFHDSCHVIRQQAEKSLETFDVLFLPLQLVNHGVDGGLLGRTKADVADFFGLPLEVKSAVAIPPNGMQGFGHHFVFSEEQKLDWVDLLFLATRPADERSLDFWPTKPSTFRDTLDKYTTELASVAEQLFRFMARDLGVDQEALLGTFKGLPQCVRINYYPPCRQAGKVLGLSPHTDGVGMTLLLHANDVQGLQIRKDGEWFSVHALPGALVVNIGDVLEILSNGKYRSIEHRAVVNPDKERITIAAFHSVHLPCTIGPFQELGDARYKTVDGLDFTKGYFAAKLEGRRYLESLKL
uniref:Fe2OG dioxygenase domain-containing protein n=1 Tax=Triticum urartu TaxID=4572 RepID=A0A8R7P283_TRIUA